MSYSLSPWFDARFFKTGNNAPLAGGKIYTYFAGTTTPKRTYSDSSGTPNTNPIILDSDGRANIYLDDDGEYRFILKDANDTTYKDVDNITGFAVGNVQKADTVAVLRTMVGSSGSKRTTQTLGYYAAGDGGDNVYYWSSSSSGTDNGATIIKPNAVTGAGRWLAIKIDNVRQCGIVGDGTANDTAQWGKILALGTSVIRIPENCLISTDPFTISAGKIIEGADNKTSGFIFRDSSATYNMDLRNLTAMRFYNCIFYWNNATAQPLIFLSAAGSTDFEFCYNRVIGDAAITNVTRCVEAQSGSTLRPKINYNIFNNINCDVIRPAGATNFEVIGNQITGVGRRTAGSGANRAIIAGQANYGVISNNIIRDVTGDNCYAIDIGGATYLNVSDNVCTNIWGGIDLEGGSDNCVISNNVFKGLGSAGGWGDRGIFVNSNAGTASYTTITGNAVSDFQRGISCTGLKHGTITDNTVYNCAMFGIFSNIGYDSTISDNTVTDCNAAGYVTLFTNTTPATAASKDEVATGGTSGATGVVIAFNASMGVPGTGTTTNEIWIKPTSGTFQSGETVTFSGTGSAVTLTAGTQNLGFSGLRWNNLFADFSGNTISKNTVSGSNHLYSYQGYNGSAGANDSGDWDSFEGNRFRDKPLSLTGKIRSMNNPATGGAGKTIFADGDTSPSVAWGHIFYTANTGATTITNFDDAPYDTEIMVYFGDANTTLGFSGGATLRGNGGANKTFAAGDAIHARKVRNPGDTSSFWYCTLILK